MTAEFTISDIREKIARIEERLISADNALTIAYKTYPSKDEINSLIKQIELRITVVEKSIATDVGREAASGIFWTAIVTAINFVISVIAIFISLKN